MLGCPRSADLFPVDRHRPRPFEGPAHTLEYFYIRSTEPSDEGQEANPISRTSVQLDRCENVTNMQPYFEMGGFLRKWQ
jgi:hypothetical protein